MLSTLEQTRLHLSGSTTAKKKAQLGQFLTPARTAEFMAGLFPPTAGGACRLLDAGAGIGSLSSAFLDRCAVGGLTFDTIGLTAFELDPDLQAPLRLCLARFQNKSPVAVDIVADDFIEAAVNRAQFGHGEFSHAILNPPYKKIGSHSRHRLLLRQAGIETVNLYSAFVALTLLLMAPGGQVVAIIPRSFCNGPYYRPFREFLLARAALRHIHLFASRSQAFKDDAVLQENVILRLERGGTQGAVTVSTSTDDSFSDLATHEHRFDRIVYPHDSERFIHVPTSLDPCAIEMSPAIGHSLTDIGLGASTGPVVDFRLKAHLRDMPAPGTSPLLYPGHFSSAGIEWPQAGMKKPNAIACNDDTQKWLYPNGFYCVVRRFSSKEEKRRIVASVVDPADFDGAAWLGFENHLNVFHENKRGLPEALARGLAVFLNTTAVDAAFRRFNGHTQVNATDLKRMKYPSREALIQLGLWAKQHGALTQTMIDAQFEALS